MTGSTVRRMSSPVLAKSAYRYLHPFFLFAPVVWNWQVPLGWWSVHWCLQTVFTDTYIYIFFVFISAYSDTICLCWQVLRAPRPAPVMLISSSVPTKSVYLRPKSATMCRTVMMPLMRMDAVSNYLHPLFLWVCSVGREVLVLLLLFFVQKV